MVEGLKLSLECRRIFLPVGASSFDDRFFLLFFLLFLLFLFWRLLPLFHSVHFHSAQCTSTLRFLNLLRPVGAAIDFVPLGIDLLFQPHMLRIKHKNSLECVSPFSIFFIRRLPGRICRATKVRGLLNNEGQDASETSLLGNNRCECS